MRLSSLLLPTEREPPSDAEALSHKLMVRAGLIRQVGAGLWSWMPAGWRIHQNVVGVIRSEMDAIGAQELLMPTITPAELWKRSGRYDSVDAELFRFQDRKGADMILAMSHEETLTFHIAHIVRSYRQLPLQLYHFQTKGRDEARPRAGLLRTREFIMKDAYSFDRDEAGLDVAYEAQRAAYHRIFARCGLEFYECESDVGMMGGSGAHEFMAPCAAGENDVALAPGYAANVEVASADPQTVPPLREDLHGELHTPGQSTIEALAAGLDVSAGNLLKAFPIVTESRGLTMLFLRGDHRVNEVKLATQLGEPFRPATEEELTAAGQVPGYLGPNPDLPSLYDAALLPGRYVAGGGRPDTHVVVSLEVGRRIDVRTVEAGDTIDGTPITIEPAIEIGNIFKLGTRYSEPMGANYLDQDGKSRPIVMGSYGIGPARVAAAVAEQQGDERGISWPRELAPWDVELVAIGKSGTPEREAADRLYEQLAASPLDVLYDDRDAKPGEKFADAELLGVPLRLTLGKRSLDSGRVEAQRRRGLQDVEDGIALSDAAAQAEALWRELP
ncbi:MAG: proline--tRNA ligase [Solirubrobacterales bacterium]|nr:proline--tRNA ligase [Solirubrobacterales bacterium]